MNRCFLSLTEAFQIHESEIPRENSLVVPITGRDVVMAQLMAFLDGAQKVICVHGPGGVGKTRLLLEFGAQANEKKGYQVLWGNVETMAQSGNWLAAITMEFLSRYDEEMKTTHLIDNQPYVAVIDAEKATPLEAVEFLLEIRLGWSSGSDEAISILEGKGKHLLDPTGGITKEAYALASPELVSIARKDRTKYIRPDRNGRFHLSDILLHGGTNLIDPKRFSDHSGEAFSVARQCLHVASGKSQSDIHDLSIWTAEVTKLRLAELANKKLPSHLA